MPQIRILSRQDVARVTCMQDMIACVEEVYRQKALGQTQVWPTTFYEFDPGHADMDIKSGYLKAPGIFGHKTVSWFGGNSEKGLPELTGAIMVFSAETGLPLGLLDASYITGMRTGASGAIGAKYLARPDSSHLLVVGCGGQAIFQIAAMLTAFPGLRQVTVSNPRSLSRAEAFVSTLPRRLTEEFGLSVSAVRFAAAASPEQALETADVVITVTPSRAPLIQKEWVRSGTHFSCIGADAEGKEELDPRLFSGACVFVDDAVHCTLAGEVELPLKQGILRPEDISGEIGDLLLGKLPGRADARQTTIFDATGMALLDLAAAKTALDAAAQLGLGRVVEL